MYFNKMLFADYSGQKSEAAQKKHIAVAQWNDQSDRVLVRQNFTRKSLAKSVCRQLSLAENGKKLLIFGFDHNYNFPHGFLQGPDLDGPKSWRTMINLLVKGSKILPPLFPDVREWARSVNGYFKNQTGTAGPFWGPQFEPLKKPDFPFRLSGFSAKRLIETRLPRAQSIFKLGGAGSVGLQSLYGMGYLAQILEYAEQHAIPLHVWPQDGWGIPGQHHVLTEIYPGFYNRQKKSDRADARNTLKWFLAKQESGELANCFQPNLSIAEKKIAGQEGWLPGILT